MNFTLSLSKLKNCLSFILIFALSFIFSSCENGEPLEIYNPYASEINVELDGRDEVTVQANSFVDVNLGRGKHFINVWLDEKIILNDSFLLFKEHLDAGSFLNLTKQDLIVFEESYGDDFYTTGNEKSLELYQQLAEIDSAKAENYAISEAKKLEKHIWFYPSNQLILIKDWDFEINEGFPKNVLITSNTSLIRYKKLFTYGNFEKYINNNTPN